MLRKILPRTLTASPSAMSALEPGTCSAQGARAIVATLAILRSAVRRRGRRSLVGGRTLGAGARRRAARRHGEQGSRAVELRTPANMTLTALKVRGPFKGPSGYDHHVRELVRELHKQGVAVQLVDFPEWGPAKLPAQLQDPWFDTLDRPTGARVVVHFCMPHQVVPDAGKVNVNYTMFEATRIPPTWVAYNLRHDLVILPTESSRLAWLGSGVPAEKLWLCS